MLSTLQFCIKIQKAIYNLRETSAHANKTIREY